jgi:hypothetical protein
MKRRGVVVAVVYGLFLMALALPEALVFLPSDPALQFPALYYMLGKEPFAWVWFGILVGGAATLLLLPVDTSGRLARPKRHLWVAAVWVGGAAMLLMWAAAYSLLVGVFGDNAPVGNRPLSVALLIASWTAWTAVFYRYARGAEDAFNRATTWLLKGSVLELLIAVPSHIIVRRRDDCCAPMASSVGIATGIAVMLLSFGPGVLLLYRRRIQQRAAASSTKPVKHAVVAFMLLCAPLPAAAQLAASTERGRSFPRIDVTYSLAGFRLQNLSNVYNLTSTCQRPGEFTNCRRLPAPADTWGGERQAGAMQIGAGFYWSPQWKTEAAVAWTESGRGGRRMNLYDEEAIYTPSSTTYVYLFHNYDVRRTMISQVYQFRAAKRWRPFVGVALGIDREERFDSRTESVEAARGEAERQRAIAAGVLFGGSLASDVDLLPTSFAPPVTATHVHAVGRAGMKYGWKRLFVTAEAQIGVRVVPVSAGLGVDLF